MTTVSNFLNVMLGFVPLVAIAALIVTVLWMITKIFPEFSARCESKMDRLFGVDADYDEKYATGYSSTPNQ